MNLEELKRRRFKMHAEWTPAGQEASAEQFAMLEEFDRQFPAIVAKLEAAQRLRDAMAQLLDDGVHPTWSGIKNAETALAAFDKEQS